LSFDAFHDRETELTVEPVFARPVGAVGAVVSPGATHALVDFVNDAWPEWLLAASYASIPSVYDVPHVSPAYVYVVLAVVPTLTPPRYAV
jgi:hypothetical protein